MRKTIFIITTTLLLLSPFIIGCNDQKEQEFGKLKEQVNVLRMENSKLKKEIARKETSKSGMSYSSLGLITVFIISGGLVVWVISRRRDDGTEI
jgi:cell division protein FtsB